MGCRSPIGPRHAKSRSHQPSSSWSSAGVPLAARAALAVSVACQAAVVGRMVLVMVVDRAAATLMLILADAFSGHPQSALHIVHQVHSSCWQKGRVHREVLWPGCRL